MSAKRHDDPAWWRRPAGKSRLRVLAAAAMLLPSAFLYALAADLPHLVILAALGLGVSLLVPRAVPYNHRTVIYSLLIAAVLAVTLDLVFPLDDNRFMFLVGVLAGNLTVPMLIYLGVLATFFASGPYQLGICVALSLSVAMFCGDYYGASLPNERFLLFAPLLQRFGRAYAVLVVYEIGLLLLCLQLAQVPSRNRQGGWAWPRHALTTLALGAAVAAAFAMLTVFQRFEPKFRELEMILMRSGIHRLMRRSNVVFRKEIDLYRTLNLPDGRDRRIVVRAVSDAPPGYLRARVYTHYQRGIWQSSDTGFVRLPFRRGEGALAVTSFLVDGNDEAPPPEAAMIHLYTAVDASEVLLAPGHAIRYDLVADALSASRHGMLQPEQWRRSGGYSVQVPRREFEGAYPGPLPPGERELLDIPKELAPEIAAWLRTSVPGLLPEGDGNGEEGEAPELAHPDAAAIALLGMHLLARYRYSLEPSRPARGQDPVLHFLRATRAGHCELFASATVLALRTLGIPARYATGFICAEPHPAGTHYIARMGDAHAWVEAWLRDEQRWVLVDTTPPQGIPGGDDRWGFLEAWRDRLRVLSQRILASMQRGYFAEAVITMAVGGFAVLRDLLWHPWRGTGVLLLGLGTAIALLRRWRRRRERLRLSGETLRLHRAFARFERRVARAGGLRRALDMPVGDWACAIAPRLADAEAFLDLVDRYQALRFREQPAQRPEAEPLIRELRQAKYLARKGLSAP
jgi:transglutaminase-like putative cysteine protease